MPKYLTVLKQNSFPTVHTLRPFAYKMEKKSMRNSKGTRHDIILCKHNGMEIKPTTNKKI